MSNSIPPLSSFATSWTSEPKDSISLKELKEKVISFITSSRESFITTPDRDDLKHLDEEKQDVLDSMKRCKDLSDTDRKELTNLVNNHVVFIAKTTINFIVEMDKGNPSRPMEEQIRNATAGMEREAKKYEMEANNLFNRIGKG